MPEQPAPGPDPTGARILDAAIRVLGDFGVKRATVELVAKYAGVSHMTIYRRWPSKSDLLNAAVVGEFTRVLDAAFDSGLRHGGGLAERTLTAFTETVWAVQSHPVVERELNSESGEQASLMSSISGTVMEVAVPEVTVRLARLSAASGDAPADLDAVADVFVRLAHSLVVMKRTDQPLADREELTVYARGRFGPYLNAVAERPVHVVTRSRPARPHLQLAVAGLVAVLAISAGLTLALTGVLTGKTRLSFITPADVENPAPAAPGRTPANPSPGESTAPVDVSTAGSPVPPAHAPDSSAGSPATRVSVPPADVVPPAARAPQPSPVGSLGGGPAGVGAPAADRSAPGAPPRPFPGQSAGPPSPPGPAPGPAPARPAPGLPPPAKPGPPPPPKPAPPPPAKSGPGAGPAPGGPVHQGGPGGPPQGSTPNP